MREAIVHGSLSKLFVVMDPCKQVLSITQIYNEVKGKWSRPGLQEEYERHFKECALCARGLIGRADGKPTGSPYEQKPGQYYLEEE